MSQVERDLPPFAGAAFAREHPRVRQHEQSLLDRPLLLEQIDPGLCDAQLQQRGTQLAPDRPQCLAIVGLRPPGGSGRDLQAAFAAGEGIDQEARGDAPEPGRFVRAGKVVLAAERHDRILQLARGALGRRGLAERRLGLERRRPLLQREGEQVRPPLAAGCRWQLALLPGRPLFRQVERPGLVMGAAAGHQKGHDRCSAQAGSGNGVHERKVRAVP